MPNVKFELLWRHAGASDTTIVAFTHQYPAGKTAQYEESQTAPAVAAVAGDFLVFRGTMVSTDAATEYVPFSETRSTPTARFLSIDLP